MVAIFCFQMARSYKKGRGSRYIESEQTSVNPFSENSLFSRITLFFFFLFCQRFICESLLTH